MEERDVQYWELGGEERERERRESDTIDTVS